MAKISPSLPVGSACLGRLAGMKKPAPEDEGGFMGGSRADSSMVAGVAAAQQQPCDP